VVDLPTLRGVCWINTGKTHTRYTTAAMEAFTSEPMWVEVAPDTIKMPDLQLNSKCLTIM